MSTDLSLDPARTALVLIDLQHGIVAMKTAPRSGPDVVAASRTLVDAFRAANAFVAFVRVGWRDDLRDALNPPADASAPPARRPPEWMTLVPELGVRDDDFVVTKRQFGAFHGTELDLQLRRRGIDTIVLAGISTNIGVESTARFAYEYGYAQVFVEDAMAATSEEMHAFPLKTVFPRMGRVRSVVQVVAALKR